MKIQIEIEEREINAIAGTKGEDFVVAEFKRDPHFFINNSSDIKILISQQDRRAV